MNTGKWSVSCRRLADHGTFWKQRYGRRSEMTIKGNVPLSHLTQSVLQCAAATDTHYLQYAKKPGSSRGQLTYPTMSTERQSNVQEQKRNIFNTTHLQLMSLQPNPEILNQIYTRQSHRWRVNSKLHLAKSLSAVTHLLSSRPMTCLLSPWKRPKREIKWQSYLRRDIKEGAERSIDIKTWELRALALLQSQRAERLHFKKLCDLEAPDRTSPRSNPAGWGAESPPDWTHRATVRKINRSPVG